MADSFNLLPGRRISAKYRVIEKIGEGYEGEVYKIEELKTGIHRAAKVFYPGQNAGGRACRQLAQTLHCLRDCGMLIQYHAQESITVHGQQVDVLVSEYIEGDSLADFLQAQPGGYLPAFQACHLLHALASGLADIHERGEYHGDLHASNVLVIQYGLTFSLKVIDFSRRESRKREHMRGDIVDIIRIFYDALGGQRRYARQPKAVKAICCGLKRSLILKKFPSARGLINHLDALSWS